MPKIDFSAPLLYLPNSQPAKLLTVLATKNSCRYLILTKNVEGYDFVVHSDENGTGLNREQILINAPPPEPELYVNVYKDREYGTSLMIDVVPHKSIRDTKNQRAESLHYEFSHVAKLVKLKESGQ